MTNIFEGEESALMRQVLYAASARGNWLRRIDPINERDKWLALRNHDVTASAAGALFNMHEYLTPYRLWIRKAGFAADDPTETPTLRRGRLLEPVAIALLREQHPNWQIERGQYYFRDPVNRIGATPDAFAIDPERDGHGIVQVKSVEQSVFARKWRNEHLELEPPLWIAVQALVEADLSGASWACVAALTVGFGVDLYLIDVPLYAGVLEALRERVAEFWRMIEERKPPPVDYRRDHETLIALHGADDGSCVDLTGWNRFPELAEEDGRLAKTIKEAQAGRNAIKAELLERLGAAASATIDGRLAVTAKTITRKAYTVAEKRYRDVRIKGNS